MALRASGWGFTSSPGWAQPLLRPEVAQPAPLCRDRCGLRAPTRLHLLASLTRPRPASDSASLGPDRQAWCRDPRHLRPCAPAISCCLRARLLMRCPGAVTPQRLSARGSVRPRPAPSPKARTLRRPSLACDMPRSEDRWRPACRPLPTARPRRVTFHSYKGIERAEPCRSRGGRNGGVLRGAWGEERGTPPKSYASDPLESRPWGESARGRLRTTGRTMLRSLRRRRS